MIRPLVPADARQAVAVIHAAFGAQSVATDPPSSALRETEGTVAAHIATHGGLCAMTGEAPTCQALAGVVLWAEREGGLYLGRLAVLPALRGAGLGRALVAQAEAEAVRRGLPRVHLSTRLKLLDNRRFFAACGYRETGQHAHAGYAAPTSVTMEKLLSGIA